jgi:hypothetical protein
MSATYNNEDGMLSQMIFSLYKLIVCTQPSVHRTKSYKWVTCWWRATPNSMIYLVAWQPGHCWFSPSGWKDIKLSRVTKGLPLFPPLSRPGTTTSSLSAVCVNSMIQPWFNPNCPCPSWEEPSSYTFYSHRILCCILDDYTSIVQPHSVEVISCCPPFTYILGIFSNHIPKFRPISSVNEPVDISQLCLRTENRGIYLIQ